MPHCPLPISILHVFNNINPCNWNWSKIPIWEYAAKLHRPNPKTHRDVLLMWPQTQLRSVAKHRQSASGAIDSSCLSPDSIASFQRHNKTSESLKYLGRGLQGTLKGVGATLNREWTLTPLLWLRERTEDPNHMPQFKEKTDVFHRAFLSTQYN